MTAQFGKAKIFSRIETKNSDEELEDKIKGGRKSSNEKAKKLRQSVNSGS